MIRLQEVWKNHEQEETVPSIKKGTRARGQPGANLSTCFSQPKARKGEEGFDYDGCARKGTNAHGSYLLLRVYIRITFWYGTQTYLDQGRDEHFGKQNQP